MLYDLRRAALPIKWLVTWRLATLGLPCLFGALMISLYAGFTPQRVAATYAGPEMSMRMPPETTMVVEHPITRADFAQPEVHAVDTNLLIQDTHVHVPMYGIIARSEEHTSELQSRLHLVCRLLLEKKKEVEAAWTR